jgi:hypothetical protein
MPYVSHFPNGREIYEKLNHGQTKDSLEYNIHDMIDRLQFSIEKYDYLEHKKMATELKTAKEYLEYCLKELREA